MISSPSQISPLLRRQSFKIKMCPFLKRLYRTALIVTGNPRAATKLWQKLYRRAWANYRNAEHIADFQSWLAQLLHRQDAQVSGR